MASNCPDTPLNRKRNGSDDVSWELEGDAEEAEKEAGMGDLQREIVDYLKSNGPTGPRELARELGKAHGTITNSLARMGRSGIIVSEAGKWRTM